MIRNYENPDAERQFCEFQSDFCRLPLYYTYNGTQYKGFDNRNMLSQINRTDKAKCRETVVSVFSLDDELTAELTVSFYKSHGVTEWSVCFENNGSSDSKIFENVYTMMEFAGDNPQLKGIYGDHENQYAPYCFDLNQEDVHFKSDSGRATHVYFPYFNLEYADKGTMLAIGWAGTWTADFCKTAAGVSYMAKSINNLCTYLKPGEKIRTATFVVASYGVRNEHYATNYWRSWFVNCNMPSEDASGKLIDPFSTICLDPDTGLPTSDGSISECHTTWRPSMEKMIAEGVNIDFRWCDAGWYVAPDMMSALPGVKGHDWWDTVGTWEFDPAKWPGKTFRESTDFAREHGMRTLLWFEPERVTFVDDLVKNFGYKKEWAIVMNDDGAISNNIGDDECRRWTTDRICKTLKDNKVEMYREDNNCDAAQLWAFMDEKEGADRCGITESKFINGHYLMWDDIIRCTLSYDGCGFVDSCASGGGRNDIESLRRGVPLLRSDADRMGTALRLSMNITFNKWIPMSGACTLEKKGELDRTGVSDSYVWRASYLAVLNVQSQFVQNPSDDYSMLKFGLSEWAKVKPYLLKEFYVLTPWHGTHSTNALIAYSYFDPDTEKGLLLAFRQEECVQSKLNIDLPYVTEDKKVIITDEDTDIKISVTGGDLREGALELDFDEPRSAKLLWIELV